MSGRIRSIKPELLDDDRTAALSDSAWRLFVSSWLLADDHGNLRLGIRYLAASVWLGAGPQAKEALEELTSCGLIVPYAKSDQMYGHITGWAKHQRIDNASKPRVPVPAEDDGTLPTWFRTLRPVFAEFRGDSRRNSANLGGFPRTSEDFGEIPLDHRPPTIDHRPTKGTSDARDRAESAPFHDIDSTARIRSADQAKPENPETVQAPPGRVDTAMPGQEALDPVPAPPTPQGAAAIDIQPRPLPASESRLMGSVWIEAYERAARDTWDYPRWTFEPRQLSTLDRVISTQCETPDRARICDWIHRTVVEFAKAIGDKRQFWAGGQPAGLEKWLNCGKPAEKALSASPVTRADIESAMHPSRRKFKKDGTYAD